MGQSASAAHAHGRLGDSGPHRPALPALALAALGVVYGDIGTSPLYAMKEAFVGAHPLAPDPVHVFGVLSLMFWSIMLVVTLKYVAIIMRADNKGEGGIMALMALAQRGVRGNARLRWVVIMLGLLGASLFYGDGVITRLRIPDPTGGWLADAADPRVLVEADAMEQRAGAWRVVTEGRDGDGDGDLAVGHHRSVRGC